MASDEQNGRVPDLLRLDAIARSLGLPASHYER